MNYIVVDSYVRSFLGKDINLYKIKLNNSYKCKHYTIKRRPNILTRTIKYFKLYSQHLNTQKKIYKNDSCTKNLIQQIKPYKKYTYCLENDKLIIAETKQTILRDLVSKHFMICGKTCASGEMVIKNNMLVFDNSSGTYKPRYEDIKILKKALSFLDIKILSKDSPEHSIYFSSIN